MVVKAGDSKGTTEKGMLVFAKKIFCVKNFKAMTKTELSCVCIFVQLMQER